jgi:acetyl-CoA carboxylase carboxyl transferase subunit alpha
MNGIWLNFERPIIELEKKIEELKGLKGVNEEIKRLESQAKRLKKKIYSNLSRWQRVQLARHPRRPYPLDIIPLITEDFIEGTPRKKSNGILVCPTQKDIVRLYG